MALSRLQTGLLVTIKVYLILSLNFIGVFGQHRPRISWRHGNKDSHQVTLVGRLGRPVSSVYGRSSIIHSFRKETSSALLSKRKSSSQESDETKQQSQEVSRSSQRSSLSSRNTNKKLTGKIKHAHEVVNSDVLDLGDIKPSVKVQSPKRPKAPRRNRPRRPVPPPRHHLVRRPPPRPFQPSPHLRPINRPRPDSPIRRRPIARPNVLPGHREKVRPPRPHLTRPQHLRPYQSLSQQHPGYPNAIVPPNLQNSEDQSLISSLLSLVDPSKNKEAKLTLDPALVDIDADYYADYESGAYFEPRPPSLSSRVAKWFDGFKPPPDLLKPGKNRKSIRAKPSSGNSLDYDEYDTDENHNLIFYNQNQESVSEDQKSPPKYDFTDVLNSIRNNETEAEVIKKALSAAAALTERSATSPTYMLWTIPTTLLAVLGGFYFVGAVTIIGYQATLGNGLNETAILPTIIALSVPLVLAFIIVTARDTINGKMDMARVMRGDFRSGLSPTFDGVDFTLDALFGSAALLGVGWLFSIAI